MEYLLPVITYALVPTIIVVEVIGAVGMCVLLIHQKPWREVVHPDRMFWHRPVGIVLSVFLMSTLWWAILGIAVLHQHPRTRRWFS